LRHLLKEPNNPLPGIIWRCHTQHLSSRSGGPAVSVGSATDWLREKVMEMDGVWPPPAGRGSSTSCERAQMSGPG
jgi:hypothetical protein